MQLYYILSYHSKNKKNKSKLPIENILFIEVLNLLIKEKRYLQTVL